jgi:2-dehydropantoate 2-reductase
MEGLAIVGAGSVGLSLAARLAASGARVTLVAHVADGARRIAERGIELLDPANGERLRARPTTVRTLDDGARLHARTLVVCVRAPDSDALVAQLAERAPGATIVCAQNDVDNEARFALRFERVVGCVVRQTCTRTAPDAVNALGAGRLVFGAWPSGESDEARSLAAVFDRAGFDVAVSRAIAEDKWLKLCVNLMSVPNALIHPDEHATRAFVEIKARLLEEARDALAAAGIAARSCDGRDRSLDEEIAFQRASLLRGESARRLPVFNAVWGALTHGSALEADLYHERIVALADAHGIAAPTNRRALELARRAWRERLGPESARCADFSDARRDR